MRLRLLMWVEISVLPGLITLHHKPRKPCQLLEFVAHFRVIPLYGVYDTAKPASYTFCPWTLSCPHRTFPKIRIQSILLPISGLRPANLYLHNITHLLQIITTKQTEIIPNSRDSKYGHVAELCRVVLATWKSASAAGQTEEVKGKWGWAVLSRSLSAGLGQL